MIFISIITLIAAKALPLFKKISSIHISRIASIIFIYTGASSFNCFYIQSIGSGIGIYSGLFHITPISQLMEIFLFFIGGCILIGWPQVVQSDTSTNSGCVFKFNGPLYNYNYNYKSKTKSPVIKSLDKNKNIDTEFPPLNSSLESYSTDYSIIVLFSILGSSLLISSFDLISVYLSIELQSFGLYILATLYRNSESATSAGLKYFLLGGFSSCLILLGIGLIYSYTGLTNFESLYFLNSISGIDQPTVLQGLSLGLIIIFVGFLFKIAAAPLHNWSPDVYDGTPTIVTTWLTIIPKIAIFIFLLELYTQIGVIGGIKSKILSSSGYITTIESLSSLISFWEGASINLEGLVVGLPVLKSLLLISSILSLIIGSLLGLAQIRIKRLLAYSTISHIGFLLLSLAINTEQSIDSFLFYLIQYTITNLNIFLIILAVTYSFYNTTYKQHKFKEMQKMTELGSNIIPKESEYNYDYYRESNSYRTTNNNTLISHTKLGQQIEIRYIYELKGLFFTNPLLSLSLCISLFSMAGLPPLIGFFSKQFVLYSALQNGYYFISLIAIIVSVISASYYLKIIKVLHTDNDYFEDKLLKGAVEENKAPNQNNVLLNEDKEFKEVKEFKEEAKEGVESRVGVSLSQSSDPILLDLDLDLEQSKTTLTNTHSFVISSLTLIILLFFIKPSIILNSTQLLSLSLFYI